MRITLVLIIFGTILFGCGSFFSKEKVADIPSRELSFRTGVVRYLDDQISKYPDDPKLYLEKARYLRNEGWPNEALTILNEAIKLDSGLLDAYYLRQSYFLSKGRYKDALKDISILGRNGISTINLNNNKITAYYGQQNFKMFLSQVLQYQGILSNANRQLLSQYFLSKSDTLLAIRHGYLNYLSRAMNRDDKLLLAELLLHKGFVEKSLEVLDSDSTEDNSYGLLKAEVLLKSDYPQKGVIIIKKQVLTGNFNALTKLNDYYGSEGQIDSAIYFNNVFLQNADSTVTVLNMQAGHYKSKYFWVKALKYYELALKKDPANQEALKEASFVRGKIAYLRNLKAKNTINP